MIQKLLTPILCGIFFSNIAVADSAKGSISEGASIEDSNPNSEFRFQPCEYWRYNPDIQGYACNWTGPTISVLDAYEVRSSLAALNDKISMLEARIRALESQK